MKINTFGYSVKQGLKNIRRNLLFSLASVGTIVACLFLFGIFYAIVLNMESEIQSIENSLTVSVFFEKGTDENEIMVIGDSLKQIENIDTMNFISADKAWNGYINDVYNGDEEYVNSVFGDDNPLINSSSYELTLKDIDKQEETVSAIQEISGVRRVNSSDGTAKSLSAISRLVGYASVGVITILLFVSLFLISNTITIGISVRKEEIAIMKLIGAKDLFVRAPFLVEGVIIGLTGSMIPLIFTYFLYNALTKYLTEHFAIVANMIEFAPVSQVFAGMAPISILLGVGVGFLGSLLTTHRHLRI
ncbi:MAG: permease-like cell division protein FtsX [Bacteroidales bacterium]|nr:permease-like cell division protein FtsX [Clostridium sp.]MCM1205009.1 permease-like cell division protein FtsX [Bacteroidales bacterium]